MKNNIVIIFILSISSLSAQEDYGLRNVAGGQFNFSRTKEGGSKIDNFPNTIYDSPPKRLIDLQPYVAWKIKRNMLLGVRAGFHNETEYGTVATTVGLETIKFLDNTYSVGVFTRHYLTPEKPFRFFLEPSGIFARTNHSEKVGNEEIRTYNHINLISLKVSPGVSYQLTQHFGLLIKLGQFGVETGKLVYSEEADTSFQEFFADLNLASFALGVEYRW